MSDLQLTIIRTIAKDVAEIAAAMPRLIEAMESQDATLKEILASMGGDGAAQLAAELRRIADEQANTNEILERLPAEIVAEIES